MDPCGNRAALTPQGAKGLQSRTLSPLLPSTQETPQHRPRCAVKGQQRATQYHGGVRLFFFFERGVKCAKKKKPLQMMTTLHSPTCAPGEEGTGPGGEAACTSSCPWEMPSAPLTLQGAAQFTPALCSFPRVMPSQTTRPVCHHPLCLAQLLAHHAKWVLQGVEKGHAQEGASKATYLPRWGFK